MRVTRAIREYVEEDIRVKYDMAIAGLEPEYKAEKEAVERRIEEIRKEACDKAMAYLAEVGYERSYHWHNEGIFEYHGSVVKRDKEDRLGAETSRLRNNMLKKQKQVLFDLEMGETNKAELKEILDSVVID